MKYEQEKAIAESESEEIDLLLNREYCTCSVIDLLMQADQVYGTHDQKLNSMISKHFIGLF